jgi:hypothetical protein
LKFDEEKIYNDAKYFSTKFNCKWRKELLQNGEA